MPPRIAAWLIGLDRRQKRLIQLLIDAILIVASFLGAMFLRLDSADFLNRQGYALLLAIFVPISLVIFVRLGFYRAIVRYITAKAYTTLLTGVVISAIALVLVGLVTGIPVPRSVPVIYALLALVLIGGLRFFMRWLLAMGQMRPRKRVVIYGAGASGRQLQLSLINGPEYLPVAFVDDDPGLQGRFIGSNPVRKPEDLPQIIRDYGAESLLLAMPSLSRSGRVKVLNRVSKLPVQIQTIPGIADLVSGRTKISEISNVAVEELLGRDPVPPRADLMDHDIRDKVVLVTGAGGSIGAELCRQVLPHGPRKLVLFELSEFNLYAIEQSLRSLAATQAQPPEIVPVIGSVQHGGRIAGVLRDHGVQTIYHAAAYKHVPLVEANVIEGVRNNVFGTRTLAEAAIAAGVGAFILISTDKAVRPTSVMGASKRMAELVCQAMAVAQTGTRFSMVRFGNVLGSSGSVIPLFRQQIAAGGPITVTHPEITRYFMTIPEAAQLVIQAGAMSKGGDVFVLDMGEPVRITDLAVRMVQLSGLEPVLIPPGMEARPIGAEGDIEIRFSGLRPGEKLYEELLIGTGAAPTEHERIMTAQEVFLSPEELSALLDKLMELCVAHDVAGVRRLLAEAPTGYVRGVEESPPYRTGQNRVVGAHDRGGQGSL